MDQTERLTRKKRIDTGLRSLQPPWQIVRYRDGYLADYEPVTIKSGVLMNGVFLKEGELVENVDTDTGTKQLDLLEDERQFPAEEVERKLTAPDCNRKVIQELAKYAVDSALSEEEASE